MYKVIVSKANYSSYVFTNFSIWQFLETARTPYDRVLGPFLWSNLPILWVNCMECRIQQIFRNLPPAPDHNQLLYLIYGLSWKPYSQKISIELSAELVHRSYIKMKKKKENNKVMVLWFQCNIHKKIPILWETYCASTFAVASSRTKMVFFFKIARAKHNICRCPLLKFPPFAKTVISRLWLPQAMCRILISSSAA